MAEIIISMAAKVLEYLVAPVIREGYYFFCARKITKNLENEKVKLTLTRDDVYQHVEEAKRRTEEIDDSVEKWQHEVQNLMEELENMEQEIKENSCFNGLYPTWRRYRLCKWLAKKTEIMTELNNNSEFERLSHLATLPSINYVPSRNLTFFESTKLAYDQLLEAIRDDDCYIIGLYGMGGCGKTTLVLEVGKRAMEMHLFDKVVFTVVSQSPDVRRIQHEIADFLGLQLGEETLVGRAKRLALRLQSGERILVILDDVWEKLNPEEIGIPLLGNLKGCKVLLTTRRQRLCTEMECQKKVPLLLLSEEEAWILFQKCACIVDESSSGLLNTVAREVAMECKGLPIAILAVGTALKGKPLDEWKVALDELRHSNPTDEEQGPRDVFASLQLSYDYLRNKRRKSLFLMCSMFPEDHEISKEDLFRYGKGWGLYEEAYSFDKYRNQFNADLNHLLDSCLLLLSERSKNHLKMHDVVRDVALRIASKEHLTVMVSHEKGLNSLALDGAIKNCCAVSSWYRGDNRIPQQLDAPKLEILLLNSSSILDLSYASFAGMKGLKVMAIINSEDYIISSIQLSFPQSIPLLTTLRTLLLVGCELGDISFVVSLKSLEILDLRKSKFKALPNGIEKLNKLKLLDLSCCSIDDSCDEVIGKCSQLEELCVYSREEHFGATIIGSYDCFLENLTFPKLQRFILQIGQFKGDLELWHSSRRVLLFGELNISTSNAIIKDLLQRAEDVGLDSLHGGCKSIIPEFVEAVGSMNQLTKLWLHSCSEIEFLIHSTSHHDHDFPMFFELRLQNMDNLKQVFHGPPPLRIFQNLEQFRIDNCCQLHSIFPGDCDLWNLKYLSISNCPQLTLLFPMSVAITRMQLETIVVRNCCEVRHIFMNEGQIGSDTGDEILSFSEIFGFSFPKLKCLSVSNCDKLEYLLPISFAKRPEQLQELWFQNASELKNVFGKHEELGIPNFPQMKGIFPREWNLINLKILSIGGFPECTSLFSISVAQSLLVLEELHVEKCRELKYILFNEEDDTATREQKVPVPDNSLSIFSNLKILTVSDCDKLEYLFPIYCAQGLVRLQKLKVRNAPQMKYVFGKHDQKRTPALEPSKTSRNLLRKQSSKMAIPEETGHD